MRPSLLAGRRGLHIIRGLLYQHLSGHRLCDAHQHRRRPGGRCSGGWHDRLLLRRQCRRLPGRCRLLLQQVLRAQLPEHSQHLFVRGQALHRVWRMHRRCGLRRFPRRCHVLLEMPIWHLLLSPGQPDRWKRQPVLFRLGRCGLGRMHRIQVGNRGDRAPARHPSTRRQGASTFTSPGIRFAPPPRATTPIPGPSATTPTSPRRGSSFAVAHGARGVTCAAGRAWEPADRGRAPV